MSKRLLMALLVVPLAVQAQQFETSPAYQKQGPAPSDSLTSWTNFSDPFRVQLKMTYPGNAPGSAEAPWKGNSEAFDVDGVPEHRVIHWLLWNPHYGWAFGYNLVLEPVPGGKSIRCTFEPFTFSPKMKQGNLILNEIKPVEPAGSIVIDSGDTLRIGMLPDPNPDDRLTQYVTLELSPARKTQASADPQASTSP